METYEQKKRRLFGKQYMPIYLEELRKILKIEVSPNDLLSIVETDNICQTDFSNHLKDSVSILFEEKEKLKEILFSKTQRMLQSYYVFTSHSLDCGVYKLKELQDFNFDFSFEDERKGLISFVREDLCEKILLDFSEENKIKYLEVEIFIK